MLPHTQMVGLYHIAIIMYFLNIIDTLVNPLIMVLKLGVEGSPPLAMEFQQVQSEFAQIIQIFRDLLHLIHDVLILDPLKFLQTPLPTKSQLVQCLDNTFVGG